MCDAVSGVRAVPLPRPAAPVLTVLPRGRGNPRVFPDRVAAAPKQPRHLRASAKAFLLPLTDHTPDPHSHPTVRFLSEPTNRTQHTISSLQTRIPSRPHRAGPYAAHHHLDQSIYRLPSAHAVMFAGPAASANTLEAMNSCNYNFSRHQCFRLRSQSSATTSYPPAAERPAESALRDSTTPSNNTYTFTIPCSSLFARTLNRVPITYPTESTQKWTPGIGQCGK